MRRDFWYTSLPPQHPDRPILPLILTFINTCLARGHKSALLHHTTRGWIIDEMAADKRLNLRCLSNVIQHQTKCFRADALIPIRLGNPITTKKFALSGRELTITWRAIAYGSNGLTCGLEFDGPVGVIMKHCPNDLQTLFYTLMRRPSCARTHFRIGGIFE